MKLEVVFEDGRKETLDSVTNFKVIEEQNANEKCNIFEVASIPAEGKVFEVNPLKIDRSKFKKRMHNQNQEWIREIIQKAFIEVDKHPERYAVPFYTLIPEKNWDGYKTFAELKRYANDLGGIMANWVEQALEWAQRISNGETWKNVCKRKNVSKWYIAIVCGKGFARFAGVEFDSYSKVVEAGYGVCSFNEGFNDTVPLVRISKE